MAEPKEKDVAKEMIAEAAKAYGIDSKSIFSSNYHADKGEVIILTAGGKKVHWTKGMQVKPLGQIAVTGINPNPKSKKLTPGPKEKGKSTAE
ncbi:MAG: hypothetical protein JXA07_04135 [Spirochaetes bacterium]|nr:hypothetical protein [Spirochaetota bacterium]